MKKISILLAAVALTAMAAESRAQQAEWTEHFKPYGFIRNYFDYDNRESVAGTGDLYYWLPKDRAINEKGVDMNRQDQFRFLALTSRLGFDITGFKVGSADASAKIEADFYAGLSGSTGTASFRLRQAFVTLKWNELGAGKNGSVALKMGQAWHPMAADLPDVFSLESGAPFNAFSRTPQVTADFGLSKNFSITASALWQMQYCSMGPVWTKQDDGSYAWKSTSSADFIKYACTPEIYLALNFKSGGFLGRAGVDILSIKPRDVATVGGTKVNVKDRITTVSPYLYLQYTKDLLKLKLKTIYSSAGEHVNLMSGYAVYDKSDETNWKYTPIHTTSTWFTAAYGKKVVGAILLGYIKNLGTSRDIVDASYIYFQKNGSANVNSMFRIQPEVTYNVGKFTLGLEYMLTAVQYGGKTFTSRALANTDLHWVVNNRVQMMVKFTF